MDQGGFILSATLIFTAVVTLMAVILVSMTMMALTVSTRFRSSATRAGAADSAMNSVVNDLRVDPSAAGHDCYGSGPHGGHPKSYEKDVTLPDGTHTTVYVECDTTGPTTDSRDITLQAFTDSDTRAAGVARFTITDKVGTESRPGIAVTICDWQLGQAVGGSPVGCT